MLSVHETFSQSEGKLWACLCSSSLQWPAKFSKRDLNLPCLLRTSCTAEAFKQMAFLPLWNSELLLQQSQYGRLWSKVVSSFSLSITQTCPIWPYLGLKTFLRKFAFGRCEEHGTSFFFRTSLLQPVSSFPKIWPTHRPHGFASNFLD